MMGKTLKLFLESASGIIALFLCGGIFFAIQVNQTLHLPSQAVLFTIAQGQSVRSIGNTLQQEGVIPHALVFDWYVKFFANDKIIQAGEYRITAPVNLKDLVSLLEKGPHAQITLTFPEGFTLAQITARLQGQGFAIGEEDFSSSLQLLASFPFLATIPQNASLEGFLFPDSYSFPIGASAKDIRAVFLDNFQKRVDPVIKNNPDLRGHTLFEIVTVASIVERELQKFEDKKIAAGILWRRLAIGVPLQVDATTNYITRKHSASLNTRDLAPDSRYNMYKYAGLPPGPISNPGIESIKAAIAPQESEYWFYLSRQDTDQTIFSKTLQEHNIAKAMYVSR